MPHADEFPLMILALAAAALTSCGGNDAGTPIQPAPKAQAAPASHEDGLLSAAVAPGNEVKVALGELKMELLHSMSTRRDILVVSRATEAGFRAIDHMPCHRKVGIDHVRWTCTSLQHRAIIGQMTAGPIRASLKSIAGGETTQFGCQKLEEPHNISVDRYVALSCEEYPRG